MSSRFGRTAAAALMGALLSGSAAGVASAQSASTPPAATQHLVLQTRIVDVDHPSGEIDGRLNVTITPDGIVQGRYQPQDELPHDVVGGLTGTKIWLDLGPSQRGRFMGTLVEGKLRATRVGRAKHGTDTFLLESVAQTPA